MKRLDGVYCVVGDPAVVATYQPALRKGFYLPGDISVRAEPVALRKLG